MKPLDAVREMYREHLPGNSLEEDIAAYLEVGVVVSTPRFFLMARPIERSNPQAWDHFARYENPDTWLIWAAAGDDAESVKTFCLQIEPRPLRWVAWARRDGPLKFHLIKRNDERTRFYEGLGAAGAVCPV